MRLLHARLHTSMMWLGREQVDKMHAYLHLMRTVANTIERRIAGQLLSPSRVTNQQELERRAGNAGSTRHHGRCGSWRGAKLEAAEHLVLRCEGIGAERGPVRAEPSAVEPARIWWRKPS